MEFHLIIESHNPGDIAFIKSILIAEDIEYIIQNENVSPYLFNALPMRVLVNKEKIEIAREVLKDFNLSFAFNVGENKDK